MSLITKHTIITIFIITIIQCFFPSGVVLKNEVGERLEIEVETVAKSAILQEFSIV